MECLAPMVMEGSTIQMCVRGERIGNESEVGKKNGLSMIILLLAQVLGVFFLSSYEPLSSLLFCLKNLIEFEFPRLRVEHE